METPSSARRVTRSQAACNTNNIPMSKKIEESETGVVSKSRRRNGNQQDRSALIDITNDSPIVGLAMGNLETPLSNLSKKRTKHNTTPGSGEALLRGQVKTLLQKVEEEAELSKISFENRPNFLILKGLVNSPMGLLAPTPANTPHIPNVSGDESGKKDGLESVMNSPVEDLFSFSQMVTDLFEGKKKQEIVETEKNMITRSLFLDFSEKSEGDSVSSDCTSVVIHRGEKLSMDDDDSSVWSIQVNASTGDYEEEEDEEFEDVEKEEDYEEGEEGDEEDGELVDELCEGIKNIIVTVTKFSGKHTRFVYNSDGEIEGEEESGGGKSKSPGAVSSSVLRLNGLPTPKGKHLRFPEEVDF